MADILLYLKWLIDPFFYSTSNGALVFLSVGLAISLLTVFISSKLKIHSVSLPGLLPCFLLAGGIIGQLHYLVFLHHTRGALSLGGHFYSGGANTYNHFLHHHMGKLAISFLSSDGQFFKAFDLGQVLIGMTSPLWTIILLTFIFLSLYWYIRLLPSIATLFSRSISLTVLFILAYLSCLKGLVDGGLLTYRFLPSLLIIFWLLRGAPLSRGVFMTGLVALGAYALMCTLIGHGSLAQVAQDAAPLFSIFLLLMLHGRATTVILRLLRATAVIVFLIVYLEVLQTTVNPFLSPVSEGTEVWQYLPDEDRFAARGQQFIGASPLEIYRALGEDPLKPRRVWIGNPSGYYDERRLSCRLVILEVHGSGGTLGGHVLQALNNQPLAGLPGVFNITWRLGKNASEAPPFYARQGDAVTRNNHYVWMHTLATTLRGQGIATFLLQPLLANDETPDQ